MHTPRLDSARLRIASLLLAILPALAASVAFAQSYEGQADPAERMAMPLTPHPRPARGFFARPARVTASPDSVWVGHSIQIQNPLDHTTSSFGPYHVGVGLNRPQAGGSAAQNSGFWDWDHFAAGESDSLQGWWPTRRQYNITGGLTIADDQRPWWAVDVGNQGNYVLNSANGRTRGVVGYWHVDGGTDYTIAPGGLKRVIPATNPTDPGFAPLDAHGSAWCGLRAHGDVTYADPVTGNPYNAMVLELVGEGTSSVGTTKKFPGYPGQMDQMLYRDVEMTSSSATLSLSFLYRTAMSTSTTTAAATRTGWFQFDPTVVGPVAVAGPNAGIANYVANTGTGQPADSFMVYIGVPVDINRGAGDGSDDVYLADGSHKVPQGPQAHGVYDLKRRWLSEVVRLDMPIQEVLHVSGNTNTSFSTGSPITLSAFYAPQASNAHQYVRIVFRAKTNRGFDDLTGGTAGAFNSGRVGAVLIDDVTIGGSGLTGPAVGTSAFESTSEIDDGPGTDALALSAWRATGKPPAVFFHTHPLAGGDIGGANVYDPLTFQDLCGPPGSPARLCNMVGVVISAGDHDHGEAAGGLVAGTPERERMDGMLSPTINLASSGTGDFNACGLDKDWATPQDDYYLSYEVYAGDLNLFFSGNGWNIGFQSYPVTQSDGVKCWGEVRIASFQLFEPDVRCLRDALGARQNGLIKTTNVGAVPDSMRLFLGKNQMCFRFGVTGAACSSRRGAYFDNVSLLISDVCCGASVGASAWANLYAWINDTFPTNDNTSPVPGAAVAPGTAGFDTAAAYIKSGLNTAQSPGDAGRFDIPGDSVVVGGVFGGALGDRMDMVFRIKPGVGNYHVIGDPTSGLRPVPTDPVNIVTAGDNSFWGQYMASPGTMSKGLHGPGNFWNRNVWNSARIDTVDINIFPVQSNPSVFDVYNNFILGAAWMATYHESDPKVATLGISHNRCFLVDPAGAVNSTNITCAGAPPAYGAAQGYDGVPTTKEGTKIIPDGLLTPGAHVEYFFRLQPDGPRDDVGFVMVPETTIVIQPYWEENSDDGHRWQQFGVLPDRWKDPNFGDGGQGMACMLYVDLDDHRGDERVWVSITDSLGLTSASRRGAHNGWHANCSACLTDATGLPVDVSTNPAIARYDHGGQPGTSWDMFGVKAAELPTAGSGQLGSRMGPQATGLAAGKDSKQGPTPEMLRTYYKVLVILSGDISSAVLGPFWNRGADDVALLKDFMTNPAPGSSATTRRAVYVAGSGFVQSEYATGSVPAYSSHMSLLTDYLGVTIKTDVAGNPQYAYQPWSGNFAQYASLTTSGPLAGVVANLGNACLWGNDVLDPVANGLNASASGYYPNVGANGPYASGVFTPIQIDKFYESFVDGYDIQHLYSAVDGSTMGRLQYFLRAFNQMQGFTGCPPPGEPIISLDVPGSSGQGLRDFMTLLNNPMAQGRATVRLGIAHADRVTVRLYDVSGRLIRTLADRNFAPGQYDLVWDGTDDRGRAMKHGVYFADVRYAKAGFREARKLIVLR